MAKKRKAKKSRKVTTQEALRKKADPGLDLPHGHIDGAYKVAVEQMHPDGYDDEKPKRKAKRKAKKTKRKVARKVKVRRKK
jgi:hypothetical protein